MKKEVIAPRDQWTSVPTLRGFMAVLLYLFSAIVFLRLAGC